MLQTAAWYPPYSSGGTEFYLSGLVRGLSRVGVQCSVAIPAEPHLPRRYVHEDVDVVTYADAREFQAILSRGFDIYHQHSWTSGCGPVHFTAAKAAGLRTIVTVHTPNASCLRGTMMKYGSVVCSGRIEERSCAACWAQSRGAPTAIAHAVAALPAPIARLADRSRGRVGEPMARALTLAAARTHVATKRREIDDLVTSADRVVAVCEWLREMLVQNGVPADRIILSRQGLDADLLDRLAQVPTPEVSPAAPVVFTFIGRIHVSKGCDLAIKAFRALGRDVNARLDLWGVAQGEEGKEHEALCRRLAGDDSRIRMRGAFSREELPRLIAEADVVIIPSQWRETGPLVLLEAFAAGRWVIGADQGGIRELLVPGVNGDLAHHDNIEGWTQAMATFIRRRRSPARVPVRSMCDAAVDMKEAYELLVGEAPAARAALCASR